jgi:hypothetical protein
LFSLRTLYVPHKRSVNVSMWCWIESRLISGSPAPCILIVKLASTGSLISLFLGNGWLNTFPLLGSSFLRMQQLKYNNGRAVFSMRSVPRGYKQDKFRWAPDGAQHQDLLVDWPSVAMWLWLWLLMSLRWGSTPRLTDWLTVSYNVTLTLTFDEPQMGLDTKTYWLTDRQLQCDFDFDLAE